MGSVCVSYCGHLPPAGTDLESRCPIHVLRVVNNKALTCMSDFSSPKLADIFPVPLISTGNFRTLLQHGPWHRVVATTVSPPIAPHGCHYSLCFILSFMLTSLKCIRVAPVSRCGAVLAPQTFLLSIPYFSKCILRVPIRENLLMINHLPFAFLCLFF